MHFYYFDVTIRKVFRGGGERMRNILLKYVGDKAFYQRTFRTAFPLSLQMLLSSCMSIVDTMMVTRINKVTAVGTAAQIDVLQNLVGYGISSGISMFAAQFYGSKQILNLKRVFGLGLILSLINSLFWFALSLFFARQILSFYMNDTELLVFSMQYLQISKYAMIPFAINNVFQCLYRSTHQAKITLYIGIIGAIANIVLNAIFIFGLWFIPALGVRGAALGTLLGQIIVLVVNICYAFKTKQSFIGKASEMFDLNWEFVKPILLKMSPLIINESLFGFGSTLFVKAFGILGTQSMDAYYVANQIYNIFVYIVYGYGAAISILIGIRLGEGRIELAKQEQRYYLALSFMLSFVFVLLMILFAGNMVSLFGIKEVIVYNLATAAVNVLAIKISMRLINFMVFSILRAGGDAKVIQFLDSGIMYFVGLPIAFGSVYLLGIEHIAIVLLLAQIEQLVRMILGLKRLSKGYWAKDLTKLVS